MEILQCKEKIIESLHSIRTNNVNSQYADTITNDIKGFNGSANYNSVSDFIVDCFKSEQKSYFTICSKETFNNFETENEGTVFIYTPLNDHSRGYMKKGDIVFCYRQGQFGSLDEALDWRGIYAVGVVMTAPVELFKDKTGHERWGVAVILPFILKKHLELRNIQLNPKTINLTPYNGNRNDALQYIENQSHYLSLLSMIATKNPEIRSIIEKMIELKTDNILPDYYWGNKNTINYTISEEKYSKYRPFITAIKSKPFLLLAGISGTGKSRIVRELARACWDENSDEYKAQKPRNFKMVQVKPNWQDSSELIGYVSRIDGVRYVVGPFLRFMVKAMHDPDIPYFLCLDEMNLAPVEQYFAEYLSVIESRKRQDDGKIVTDPIVDYSNTEEYHSLISQLFDSDDERKAYLQEDGGKRLGIPPNLIVVGTVNMDETTFSFSRKVLDRAMTIEMNEVDLKGGLEEKDRHEKIGKLGRNELIGTAVEGVDVYGSHTGECNTAITYLQGINDVLEGTPFKVAYRTRNEFLLYVVNNLPYDKDKDGNSLATEYVIVRALDEITNMKILSRIEGDETKVSKAFLDKLKETIEKGLETVCSTLFVDGYKSVSIAKLDEMENRLLSGYTSFWS